ncbi:lactonase family protein [Sinomonas atrocyanea]|uniref:lactonase family protein n=1 Tax=Sinomonas atrocyanea TaxID=37927 RepID=UPI003D95130B
MPTTYVFVACQTGEAVDTLSLDPETGALEHVSRAEGLPRVSALALDPAGPGGSAATLYAGVNADPWRTAALALDPATGAAMPHSVREVPASTCFISLAPGGGRIFSASYHEGLMVAYPVPGRSGEVVEYQSGRNTHSAVPSPDGRFVYAASLGEDRISWFALDAAPDGGSAGEAGRRVVRPDGQVAEQPGSGPRHLRFNAAADRAYALHELSGDVTVYARDAATGALTLLQRISAVEGLGLGPGSIRSTGNPDPGPDVVWCADLRLTPDGRFLFATERSTSTIARFTVDGDGRLAFLGHTPTETQPRGIAVDPSGGFLLACGERSDHLTAYRIGDDAGLTPVSRAATAGNPLWIEVWAPQG